MSEESPLFPLKPQELISTAKSLFKSGFPISLTHLAGFATALISFHFVGESGNAAELAGVGLGLTFTNFFTIGIFISLDQGLAILASKLFGAKKYQELGIVYQRHLFVLAALSIPTILAMLFADSFFIAMGVNEDVSLNAGVFVRSMIPSIIGTFLFSSAKYFLIAQNIFITPTIITFGLIPVHALLCHIFVDIFGMPVNGVGFAKSIADITAAVILFIYIRFTGVCRESWIPWTRECRKSWDSHLQRTWILGATTFIELITYEISILFIGTLNNVFLLAAHSIAMNLASTIFFIHRGTSLSMLTMIGNAIGEGYKEKVKKILAGGILLNLITSLVILLPVVMFKQQIASFFIVDEYSNQVLQNMLLLLALTHIPESFADIIGGALKVIGKERKVFLAFIFCFIFVCLNGQWIFGVVLGYGYVGIWLSFAIAAFSMCGYVVYEAYTLDWGRQIADVKRTLEGQIYAETQSLIEFADMT